MTAIDLNASLAPEPLTVLLVKRAITMELDLAMGLGRQLATYPEDCGWDQSTFFDHDGCDIIIESARESAARKARQHRLMFNAELLNEAINQLLLEAYSAGFLGAPAELLSDPDQPATDDSATAD